MLWVSAVEDRFWASWRASLKLNLMHLSLPWWTKSVWKLQNIWPKLKRRWWPFRGKWFKERKWERIMRRKNGSCIWTGVEMFSQLKIDWRRATWTREKRQIWSRALADWIAWRWWGSATLDVLTNCFEDMDVCGIELTRKGTAFFGHWRSRNRIDVESWWMNLRPRQLMSLRMTLFGTCCGGNHRMVFRRSEKNGGIFSRLLTAFGNLWNICAPGFCEGKSGASPRDLGSSTETKHLSKAGLCGKVPDQRQDPGRWSARKGEASSGTTPLTKSFKSSRILLDPPPLFRLWRECRVYFHEFPTTCTVWSGLTWKKKTQFFDLRICENRSETIKHGKNIQQNNTAHVSLCSNLLLFWNKIRGGLRCANQEMVRNSEFYPGVRSQRILASTGIARRYLGGRDHFISV